jgi:NAD(P)-dependent dehydrogenase (short-subunit alcohol dehydrogenase family)
MEVSRQGNVGLVPGGAGGIGRATVVALPGAGGCVVVSDLATLGPAVLRYFGCPVSDDMGEILPKASRVAVLKYRSLARGHS